VQIHADGTKARLSEFADGIPSCGPHSARASGSDGAVRDPVGAFYDTTPHGPAQSWVSRSLSRPLESSSPPYARRYAQIIGRFGLEDGDVAYMGDDYRDLAVLARAASACLPRARFVPARRPDRGALRSSGPTTERVAGCRVNDLSSVIRRAQPEQNLVGRTDQTAELVGTVVASDMHETEDWTAAKHTQT